MTTKPALRTALIGFGLAGQAFHAPLIAADAAFSLNAIVTSDAERQALARARYPDAALLPNAEAVFAAPSDYDLVVIAAANRAHVPLAHAALEAGLHVLVDKPLAATADEARALAAQAKARGRVLSVYQNRRWDGDFLTLRRLLGEGALGAVHRFESRFERWRPELKGNWRESADPRDVGGVMYDLGAHLVDQALVLFGPARSVYAERRMLRPGAVVDDECFIAITHVSGVQSHLLMSLLCAAPGPRFRVLGAGAAFVKHGLDPQEDALRAGAIPAGAGWGAEAEADYGVLQRGDTRRSIVSEHGDYPAFYAALAQAIEADAAPPVTPAEAIAALEVLEAAATSARTGATIRVRKETT